MHNSIHAPLGLFSLLLWTLPLIPTYRTNCHGSSECSIFKTFNSADLNMMSVFYYALSSGRSKRMKGGPIPRDYMVRPGEQIACMSNGLFGDICLFPEGNVPGKGVVAAVVLKRLYDMLEHGCKTCGSVPLSGDNDPAKMGILTANYVFNGSCPSVCDFHGGRISRAV